MTRKSIFLLLMILIFVFQPVASELTIATVIEPPANFIDENGEIAGLAVDFVKEIQKRVNDDAVIQVMPGSRLIKMSLSEKNLVIFSLSRTPEREKKYHWVSLVMRKPLVLFAKKGSNLKIKKLNDAKKVDSIGVMRDSVTHDFLTQNGFKNIEAANDHESNIRKLMKGRISLMYMSMQGAAKLCRDLDIDFNELEPLLMPQISQSSIAISRNTDIKIVREWQKAAKEIKKDGTFLKMAQKWLEYTEDVSGIESHIKDGALNFWK